jgi:hypothetical protein
MVVFHPPSLARTILIVQFHAQENQAASSGIFRVCGNHSLVSDREESVCLRPLTGPKDLPAIKEQTKPTIITVDTSKS